MATKENYLSSFWKKPEGKPGMLIIMGLLATGGFLLYKFLPAIIQLMQNTLYAIGIGVILFAVVTILMNDKFRSTVWYLYKGMMRWFTGFVIELNPIAILESYVEDINAKIVKMEEQITGLKGQIGKIKRKLDDKTDELQLELERAQQAYKIGKGAEVTLHNKQAGRLKEYVGKLDSLYKKMEVLYKVLSKMKYYSEIMVKDTDMTVEIKKEEREAITKSHNIMKSAMNLIKGNDDKKIIFDQAMEFVVDDIGFKVGEMERMLEASTDFINSVELDNAVYEESGMQMLEEFDKKGMEAVFGQKSQEGTVAVLPQPMAYHNLNINTPTPEAAKNDNSTGKNKYFN